MLFDCNGARFVTSFGHLFKQLGVNESLSRGQAFDLLSSAHRTETIWLGVDSRIEPIRERMLTKLLITTLALSASIAASASPAREKLWIPGKGTMHRWAIDPSGVRPSFAGTDQVAMQTAADEAPCSEAEFASAASNGQVGAVLVSRHKYCQQYQNVPTMITVDLMKRTSTSQWEYYRSGVQAFEVRTFDVGNLSVRTRVHAYGASGRLAKTHRVDVAALSFSFAPGFPTHLQAGLQVTLTPDGGALIFNESAIQNFSVTVQGPFSPVTLSASTPSGSTGAFDVVLDWTYAGADPQQNITRISAFVPRYTYVVNGTPRSGATEPFSFAADSSASWLFPQMLRCDKGVVTGSPINGCVFQDAASVMSISKTGAAAEEAVHIEQAQTTRDAYKTQYSPGVFRAAAGTRAVADESPGEQYVGLVRGGGDDSGLNRYASCDAPNSLMATRPYAGSPSCPSTSAPNCSCDEYPFATTKNGGAYNPAGTSVRRVLLSHNLSGGGQLQSFFRIERVIQGEKFWVKVTP